MFRAWVKSRKMLYGSKLSAVQRRPVVLVVVAAIATARRLSMTGVGSNTFSKKEVFRAQL
jgi:hypothetical protein